MRYEKFYILPITIIAHKIYNDMIIIMIYRIAQNSGREKLWRISDFKVLARKTLANA